MKDIPTIDPMIDDIDAMIDEALANPERAEVMKSRIRARLARRVPPRVDPEPTAGDDPDDFWENVPI